MRKGPASGYSGAIEEAIASGDLGRMKRVAAEVEAYVRRADELAAALDELKKDLAPFEEPAGGR